MFENTERKSQEAKCTSCGDDILQPDESYGFFQCYSCYCADKKKTQKQVKANLKVELVRKYISREPNEFFQLDAFIDPASFDGVFKPTDDGIAYFSGLVEELMHGSNVRLLIMPGTKKNDIIKALVGFIEIIEKEWCNDTDDKSGMPF